MVTFDDEIRVIWKRKMNAISLLLLTVRWVMLAGAILTVIPATLQVSILFDILN